MCRKLLVAFIVLSAASVIAADWPQWRGLHRDARVSDFKAPVTWPKDLTKKWSVDVGDGAATPALVGDRLYLFSREGDDAMTRRGGQEILRCLDAASGKEIWKQGYDVDPSTDPGGFAGPRSSPVVAEGKVVTQGARGVLSCFDAATGQSLWRKDDFKSWPQFFVSSSPIIIDGLCVAQLGGNNGAVVAYELATGAEKWKVGDLPTAYASPVLMPVAGKKLIIAQVSDGIVGIDVANGNKVWEKFFERGGSRYKAATPIVTGTDTLIYFDGAATGAKLEPEGAKLVDKTLWTHMENRVEFNTPILRDGLLVGLTGPSGSGAHQFFCLDTQSGTVTWSSPAPRIASAAAPDGKGDKSVFGDKGGFGPKGGFGEKGGFGDKGAFPQRGGGGDKGGFGQRGGDDKGFGQRGGDKGKFGDKGGFGFKGPDGKGGFGKGDFGKGGFGRGGGGGGIRADAGYGSIVDASTHIITLTPNSELIFFQPQGKEFKQVASYKLGEPGTYAYPVVAGSRVYVKDKDSVTLWVLESD